jgi:hypothetical protein
MRANTKRKRVLARVALIVAIAAGSISLGTVIVHHAATESDALWLAPSP